MLILASKSKARQQILKNLGVKFKVVPSLVKEREGSSKTPKKTVQMNALLKARNVASRMKSGIVVACDTLVWQKGRVFGKPKNLKDAHEMLKRLSSKPHRLFTGIAVIDIKKKREIVDVEETGLVMEPLTDLEILRYFKKVTPLDKAGGFDIQGRGGSFVKHIDGCYFNVVGLPVHKLSSMLKKLGVTLFLFFVTFNLSGCGAEYNVATQREDMLIISTDQEVNMGNSLSRQVEKEYIVIQDPDSNKRLDAIGEKIAAVCDRKELIYRFRIIEDKKDAEIVNAVSLPGGYVYVFKKLLKVAKSDDELAAVLGHEVGHIVARHSVKRLQAIWGYNIVSLLSIGTQNTDFARGAQLAYMQLLTGYSQKDELLADKLGARYTKRAGYNPQGMVLFLRELKKLDKKEKSQPLSYFKTHPYISQRVRATKEEIGEHISFDDFINTI
jgi:MAF protein